MLDSQFDESDVAGYFEWEIVFCSSRTETYQESQVSLENTLAELLVTSAVGFFHDGCSLEQSDSILGTARQYAGT